jgi:hypothetical protein
MGRTGASVPKILRNASAPRGLVTRRRRRRLGLDRKAMSISLLVVIGLRAMARRTRARKRASQPKQRDWPVAHISRQLDEPRRFATIAIGSCA